MRRLLPLLALCIASPVWAAQPTVSSTSTSTVESASTNQPFTMPATINNNDVCIAIMSIDGNTAITWDDVAIGTWTEIHNTSQGGGPGFGAEKIVDDGTSDGATVTPTSAASELGATIAICFGNTNGGLAAVEAGTLVTATTSTPDPPSVTPSWGSDDFMCVAVVAWNDGTTSVSSYPTNFTGNNTEARFNNVGASGVAISTDEITGTSCDPGTYTLSASENTFAATFAVRGASAGAVYDTAPTVASQTTTAYTVTGSLDATGGTVDAVACHKDQTAPTIAQVQAGNCTGDVAAEATATQSPTVAPFDFSLVLTPSTRYEIFDLYVTDGTTLTTLADELLDPLSTCGHGAETCQQTILTSIGLGSPFAIADLNYDAQSANFTVGLTVTDGTSGATGLILADTDNGTTGTLQLRVDSGTFGNNNTITDSGTGSATIDGTASFYFAAADVAVGPTVTSPGNYAITIAVDGHLTYDDGGAGAEERAFGMYVYDTSAEADHATTVDFVANATAPICGNIGTIASDINTAITTLELDTYCTPSDAEDTMTMTLTSGTLPTGLSLSSPDVTGTPTVEDQAGAALTFTSTDLALDTDTFTATWYVIDSWTLPDCTTADTITECETQVDAVAPWYGGVSISTSSSECSETVAANDIISTSPAAGTITDATPAISAVVSTGVCFDLTGLPLAGDWRTWYGIANNSKFAAIKIQECDGDAVWAKWRAGTSVTPRGTANCVVQEDLIRQEADGSAVWARWAPNTTIKNSAMLQIDIRTALNADLVVN